MLKFEPKRHLIKVQGGRNYLPVSARLIWFRQEHPDWGIETEPITIDMDKQYAIFRARIYNAEGRLMATGTKREDIKGFPDYLEKAETGSVGRALALCGFGTQFAPELDEVDIRQARQAPGGISSARFADSPQPARGGGDEIDSIDATQFEVVNGGAAPPADPTSDPTVCADCGKSLNKAQQELSHRHYRMSLCPAHQRDHQKAVAA